MTKMDTQTIQETTARGIELGIYNTLFNDYNLSRDDIFNIFEKWANDFRYSMNPGAPSYYDQIDIHIKKCWYAFKVKNSTEHHDEIMYKKFLNILDVHYGDDGATPEGEYFQEKQDDKAWLKSVYERLKEYNSITK